MTPPLGDIAHLGHAQLFTPDLDATSPSSPTTSASP